jgi:competence protein ComEC
MSPPRTGPLDADLESRAELDLRLVPPALAAWAVVLTGLLLGPVVAGVVTGAALVVLLAARRPGRRRWGVRAAAACAAAAGLVVGAHGLLVGLHPLRGPAAEGASATLRVVVADDPRAVRAGGVGFGPGQVLVEAHLERAQVGEGDWTVGGRVLLIAPAPGWAELLPGQALTAEGLLAPATRPDLTVAVLRVRGPPGDVASPPWWQTGAGALRDGLRTAALAALPPAPGGLLPGLAVGDTSAQTAEVEDDFRAAGLSHLTAVSGANLAIVAGAVLALARVLRADPRWAALLSALAVAGFVVLARPSPSVVRAAAMAAVVLLALGLGRARSAVPALAAAVLVLLVVDPALAVDAGFALSVLATAALVLLAPGWAAALHRRGLPVWAAEALAVPAAAFLATAPVVAGLNGQVAPVAVVANLLAVPAVAPATVLGVVAALVSPVAPWLAHVLAWLAGPAVGWLVLVADRAAAVPGAVLPWPDGAPGALLLVAALAVLALVWRWRSGRALLVAVLLGLALVLVPTRLVPVGWPPAGWAVVACDVGQGDAVVLATGDPGRAVLVDAGPDTGPVDACLDRLGVHTLALVVLSHLHADHVGGLAGALRDRVAGGIAVGPVRLPHDALRRVARAAQDARAPVVALTPGQRLSWPGLVLDVLGPVHPDVAPDPEDGTAVNDGSLVLRATTAAGSVLLTGDVELAAQADLVESGTDLRADVLKMPHHGSRYSSRRSSPPSRRGRCWSAWGPATPTGTPTRVCSARWNGPGPWCAAPTGPGTPPWWPGCRSSPAAARSRPRGGGPVRYGPAGGQARCASASRTARLVAGTVAVGPTCPATASSVLSPSPVISSTVSASRSIAPASISLRAVATVTPPAVSANTPSVCASSRMPSTTSASLTWPTAPPVRRTASSTYGPSAGLPIASERAMVSGRTGWTTSCPSSNAAATGSSRWPAHRRSGTGWARPARARPAR